MTAFMAASTLWPGLYGSSLYGRSIIPMHTYYATISYKTRYVLSTIDATAYQTDDDKSVYKRGIKRRNPAVKSSHH